MHLFTDYIQPLTLWLQAHPDLALLITFFIALTESLAIIGSIIPGSVTMTAIGILAGSGVMRIELTFIAASLGAIAGDSASYLLGYIYSDRLKNIWPFSRYPNWLAYGQDYFERHGAKSVLVGRFVGPLRSVIPLIAGMMGMNQWRFFIANSISGVFWSILYVLPGVLIGAASSELSPEVATRLFILILLLLASIWLLTVGLNWLFIRINRILRTNLDHFWLWLLKGRLAKIARFLPPKGESNHYPTAALFILFILSTFFFCLLTLQVFHENGIVALNQPLFLFLQSLRTRAFDIFFTVIALIASPITLITIIISVVLLTLYYHDHRALSYWLSLNFTCAITIIIIRLIIPNQEPHGFLDSRITNSFPLPELTLATALYLTFMLFINAYCQTRYKRILKISLMTILLLAGFTPLYLGDNWLTDCLGAYLCGLSLSLLHWLFYRRVKAKQEVNPYVFLIILLLLFLASAVSGLFNYKSSMRTHQPYIAQYVFTDELWWNQTRPLLPIYRTNRIGRRISLFNIQYVGSLNELEEALSAFGWVKQNDSFFNSIIERISGRKLSPETPLIAELYLNKKPVLMMTFNPADGQPVQILRIWRSNYHLQHFHQPIWLGSVHPRTLNKGKMIDINPKSNSLVYVNSALSSFSTRLIPFPARVSMQNLSVSVNPTLLLIKSPIKTSP